MVIKLEINHSVKYSISSGAATLGCLIVGEVFVIIQNL